MNFNWKNIDKEDLLLLKEWHNPFISNKEEDNISKYITSKDISLYEYLRTMLGFTDDEQLVDGYAAYNSKKLIGILLLSYESNHNEAIAKIEAIIVDPTCTGKHFATRMLEDLSNYSKQILNKQISAFEANIDLTNLPSRKAFLNSHYKECPYHKNSEWQTKHSTFIKAVNNQHQNLLDL